MPKPDSPQPEQSVPSNRIPASRSSEESLKSLAKLVRVLDCFSSDDRTLALADIARRTGFPRSTAYRLMTSLKDVGFLEQDNERDRYRLGLKLFELGNIAMANSDLHREALPYVEGLKRMTGNVVSLAIFDGYRAVVVRRAEAETLADPLSTENAPAHCTSVGKAILAWQPEAVIDRLIEHGLERFTDSTITDGAALKAELELTRERGYAIDESEHRPGLRCIGAPIRSASGRVFAGLSTSGPTWKIAKENVEELSRVVIYHADRISRSLGYSG